MSTLSVAGGPGRAGQRCGTDLWITNRLSTDYGHIGRPGVPEDPPVADLTWENSAESLTGT